MAIPENETTISKTKSELSKKESNFKRSRSDFPMGAWNLFEDERLAKIMKSTIESPTPQIPRKKTSNVYTLRNEDSCCVWSDKRVMCCTVKDGKAQYCYSWPRTIDRVCFENGDKMHCFGKVKVDCDLIE